MLTSLEKYIKPRLDELRQAEPDSTPTDFVAMLMQTAPDLTGNLYCVSLYFLMVFMFIIPLRFFGLFIRFLVYGNVLDNEFAGYVAGIIFAAFSTTRDALVKTLICLSSRPDLVARVRQEVGDRSSFRRGDVLTRLLFSYFHFFFFCFALVVLLHSCLILTLQALEHVTEEMELTPDTVANLKLAEACVFEALRLGVNAFGSIFRKALTDIDFGDGDVIPAGTTVEKIVFSPYSSWLFARYLCNSNFHSSLLFSLSCFAISGKIGMSLFSLLGCNINYTNAVHYDESIYPNALTYDPDRWLVPDPPKPYHFIAFGSNVHRCPGRFFAVMEAQSILAVLVCCCVYFFCVLSC
jgi:hypothetical protein